MRPGISILLTVTDRRRLERIVAARNAAQKHVWRAEIVLLSANGSARSRSSAGRKIQDLRLALAGTLRR